jgi:3D (Asp-Asp-Asp) domain-containing protein
MIHTKLSFLLISLIALVLGISLHADAYRTSDDTSRTMRTAAYASAYCPCSKTEPPLEPQPDEPREAQAVVQSGAQAEAQAETQSEAQAETQAQSEPVLTQASSESAFPMPLHYYVNAGDTLYQISRDLGVSLPSLMALNDISNPHELILGQKLQIPDPETAIPLPDGQRKSIKQVLNSTLTAYTAGVESTGKTPASPLYGITYSGSKAEEGRTIAVDPSVIPLGTLVYIDGVGVRKAEDTGSAVRGAKIDIFMEDVGQALNFGVKRNVKVYVLSTETI